MVLRWDMFFGPVLKSVEVIYIYKYFFTQEASMSQHSANASYLFSFSFRCDAVKRSL